VSAILGLTNRGDHDWQRLRGLQYASLGRLTFYRAYSHLLMGVFVAHIYSQSVGVLWTGLWFAALMLVHVRGALVDRKMRDADKRRVPRSEFLHHVTTAVLSGLMWAVPLLLFAPMGSTQESAALQVIVLMLVAGSVYFYTASPISIITFATIIGVAVALFPALDGNWFVVAAIGLFLIATVLGTVEVGRSFLIARIAEDGIAEKEDVVSLLLREFEENEADWLWEVDPQRRVRSVSPRFAFALNSVEREIEGKPLLEMIAGKNWESGNFPASLHDLAERLRNRENFSNLIVQVTIKGVERWWELSGTPIRDERGRFTGFRGVGSDVTEQRESTEKIAYLARYDTLTSLPNRLMLTEALGDALQYSAHWRTRCALLMVDLDRFKAVNDSLGHMTGDKLLAQVSSRLEALVDDNSMVGRLGGDEFAIVIRDASNADYIRVMAAKLIASLSEPYQVDQHTLYVGASVGSAIGPRDGRSVEELMRNADLALTIAALNPHFMPLPKNAANWRSLCARLWDLMNLSSTISLSLMLAAKVS